MSSFKKVQEDGSLESHTGDSYWSSPSKLIVALGPSCSTSPSAGSHHQVIDEERDGRYVSGTPDDSSRQVDGDDAPLCSVSCL